MAEVASYVLLFFAFVFLRQFEVLTEGKKNTFTYIYFASD